MWPIVSVAVVGVGARALARKSSISPSSSNLICRQSSCSGVRCISGSWYGARLAHLVRVRVRVRVRVS